MKLLKRISTIVLSAVMALPSARWYFTAVGHAESNTSIVRIAGSDRYSTSVELTKEISNPSTVIMVSGENFPDALSAKNNAPRILTGKSISSSVVNYIKSRRTNISQIIIVDGKGSVSDTALNQTKQSLNNEKVEDVKVEENKGKEDNKVVIQNSNSSLDESYMANSTIKESYSRKNGQGRPIYDKTYEDMFYYSKGDLRLKNISNYGPGIHI